MSNTRNFRLIPANIYVEGHRTSVRMEPELWECLSRICNSTRLTTDQLVSSLASQHPGVNLTSLIRSYVGSLLLGRLEPAFRLAPLVLSQPKGIRRVGGVLHLIEADRAKAS